MNEELDGTLTGWIIAYEELPPEGRTQAGHFYGPEGMTTWRAIGLMEWARYGLAPDYEDDDD